MANCRTEITIPSGIWTKIIDGKTSGRVFEKKVLNSGYLTLEYDDPGDDPNVLIVPVSPNSETAEGIVFDNKEWIFRSSKMTYVWAAPVGSIDGLFTVTI